jgi:Cornifin (SPRR) family
MPKMPNIPMPKMPDISMPKVPDISMPKMPDISMPKMPDISMPKVQLPGLGDAGSPSKQPAPASVETNKGATPSALKVGADNSGSNAKKINVLGASPNQEGFPGKLVQDAKKTLKDGQKAAVNILKDHTSVNTAAIPFLVGAPPGVAALLVPTGSINGLGQPKPSSPSNPTVFVGVGPAVTGVAKGNVSVGLGTSATAATGRFGLSAFGNMRVGAEQNDKGSWQPNASLNGGVFFRVPKPGDGILGGGGAVQLKITAPFASPSGK